MVMTKKKAAAVLLQAGRQVLDRITFATDAALIEAGQAAKHRQRVRSFKKALRATAVSAAATAATAGLIVATRVVRARRREAPAARR